ncbi:two-component regulator propeller domain-containing protein [Cellulophaga omnivescoria]|uniref:two-component regulator propeller domain-containing protein n=1 Tax=Cellulophaga omnivescoria TaxID=1888890 RepID=UPI0022F0D956|nr:two-component regulator propeller domain-containing protein [Cellulophaga omnivescoria]WBU88636.1 helix-turn-helix domain-containing protein [Cellulophaga omnivescoria]
MKTKFYIVYLLLLASLYGYSQQLKFINYTTDQGLSNNSVLDIVNDNDGGLWMATWDGLNYFDGYTFTTFKHNINDPKSLQSNYLTNIEKDKNGFIWTFSNEGLISKYIGNNEFKHYKFSQRPRAMYASTSGVINVWVGNKIYKYSNGSFVGGADGASKNKEKNELEKILLAKYPNVVINDVLKDKDGNLWFATFKNGIYIIPNHVNNLTTSLIHNYTYDAYTPYTFFSNEITSLNQDVYGNVWLGQKDGGLAMAYAGSQEISSVIPHPNRFPHLPVETTRAITKDVDGNIWIGYYNSGLYHYSQKTKCYLKFAVKESTYNDEWERIRSLYTAKDGSIWVGTYAGILRIKNNSYITFEAANIPELPNNRSYSFYEDDTNVLWIACWGGIAKYNIKSQKFETFKGQKNFENYNIRNIKKDGNNLVIATEQDGVFILDLTTGKHKQLTKKSGILGNSVYSLFIDHTTSNYWIASLGGVSVYNKQKGVVKNITDANGLPSHMVYGILDNQNQIWVSTTKGIAVIDKNTYQVTPFNPKEGWQAPEFSEGAYYKDNKGLLFFGGVIGLNYFNPNALAIQPNTAKLKVQVNNKSITNKVINKKHSNNTVNVTVTPIVFPVRKASTYYYKLQGKNTDWVLAQGKQNIAYQNLASGNYTFLLKNNLNDTPQEVFSLKIEKAFYETISFFVLILMLVVCIGLLFIYLKNKTAKAKHKKLEEQITARTKLIEKQKQDLLKINSELDDKNQEIILQKEKLLNLHNNLKNQDFEVDKFKTFVLSQFQQPLSVILKMANEIKQNQEPKTEILQQSGKIIDLISEWNYLDHIKELGDVKLTSVKLLPILKEIATSVKDKLKQNNANFNAQIDKSINWVEVDLLRLKLLLKYIFNDIVKYSEAKSLLDVAIVLQENTLQFTVTSNSTVLQSNVKNIINYSPYYKAFLVLIKDLNGTCNLNETGNFSYSFTLPVSVMENSTKAVETISWKHLDIKEKLPANKNKILVFTSTSNFNISSQLLQNQDNYLLFEDVVTNLSSALKQLQIDVLVFYQVSFTKEIAYFLQKYKEIPKKDRVPLVYISEEINYALQETSLEFGIDVVIQLPASKFFISNKITSLINRSAGRGHNKFQQEIFKILTEENDLQSSNEKLLKRSLEIIKEELPNPSFNVEKLISILEISRIKCYRLFKEQLGQSPSDVITSLRLQKAEYLLKNKKFNISEIGFECGYSDSKYFGRTFKKHFGVSPKTYKEQKT